LGLCLDWIEEEGCRYPRPARYSLRAVDSRFPPLGESVDPYSTPRPLTDKWSTARVVHRGERVHEDITCWCHISPRPKRLDLPLHSPAPLHPAICGSWRLVVPGSFEAVCLVRFPRVDARPRRLGWLHVGRHAERGWCRALRINEGVARTSELRLYGILSRKLVLEGSTAVSPTRPAEGWLSDRREGARSSRCHLRTEEPSCFVD
jgi:hypothetical protein